MTDREDESICGQSQGGAFLETRGSHEEIGVDRKIKQRLGDKPLTCETRQEWKPGSFGWIPTQILRWMRQ